LKAATGSVSSDTIPQQRAYYWPETGMAEIGSVGAGSVLESAAGVMFPVDEVGSLLAAGVIGAASAGGTTGSDAAGAGSAAGAGAGAGSAAGVGTN
jgi:hypothetical protein